VDLGRPPLTGPERVVRNSERVHSRVDVREPDARLGLERREGSRIAAEDVDPQLGDPVDPRQPERLLGKRDGAGVDRAVADDQARRLRARARRARRASERGEQGNRDRGTRAHAEIGAAEARKLAAQDSRTTGPLLGMTTLPQFPVKLFSTATRATVVAAFVLALSLAPGAATAPTPLLNVGPIAVVNGIATVSGTLSS